MKNICAFPSCGLLVSARGLCDSHAIQARKGKTLAPIQRRRLCAFAGCDREVVFADLCRPHRAQQGAGQELRPIRVRVKTFCKFDECELPTVMWGYCQAHGRQFQAGKTLVALRPRSLCTDCPHPVTSPCVFPECKWLGVSHGLCPGHAWQRDRGRRLTSLRDKTPRGVSSKAEQARLKQHRRRTRTDATDIRMVTSRDWRRLVARYGGLCAYCRTRPATDQDHVIPVARGGRFAIGNLLPACRPCNSSKGAKLLVEWKRAA